MTVNFGHDGWHGTLAREVTFDRISAIGRAAASVMSRDAPDDARLVVGFDRRFLSEELARSLVAELASFGVEPWLIPVPVPTPVMSYTVQSVGAIGGIMVTAGHLPAVHNGIKLRANDGGALPRTILNDIEDLLESGATPRVIGPTASIAEFDPVSTYLEAVGEQVPIRAIQSAGLTVAIDSMWGSTGEMLPRLIEGSGTRCVEIRSSFNPGFPDLVAPSPSEENLARLRRVVSTGSAALGIALSGDGSMIAALDENGDYVSGETVFGLIAHYLLAVERQRGPLARTITGSTAVDRLGDAFNVQVHELDVGFTSVSSSVRHHQLLLAGDEWGGVILPDHLIDRDAVLAAVLLCAAVVETGQSISELIDEFHDIVGPLVARRTSVPLTDNLRETIQYRLDKGDWPSTIAGNEVKEYYQTDGVRLEFESGSWLLFRVDEFDNTLQIVAEASSQESAVALLECGRQLIFA